MERSQCSPGSTPRLTPKTGRPSKALKGLPVHKCLYTNCGKTYTRKEHLLRHERTHRNELPYVCQGCGQGYARQDLLKRHAQLKHGDSPHFPHGEMVPEGFENIMLLVDHPYPSHQLGSHDSRLARPEAGNSPPGGSIMQSPTTHHSSITTFSTSPQTESATRFMPVPQRSLPVPWGARSYPAGYNPIDVDLLRAASYGDLTEIRRLHLSGVDVLAIGQFENGGAKSALHAAAESIWTGFEDIQKANGKEKNNVWTTVRPKVEVVRYLTFHGADLNTLEPKLREAVDKALQGQPEVNTTTDHKKQAQNGFQAIAAASVDVRLPPIGDFDLPESKRRVSMGTGPLERIKPDQEETKT